MNDNKVAILVDSCCNVPKEYIEKYGMYEIPLKIIYKDGEYLDGIDITPEEVYRGLEREVPKTSLPSGEQIEKIFDQIKADGYEKVITVTISSGLSGTNNMLRLLGDNYDGLDFYVLDTKSISVGAGFHAIQAGRYLEEGRSFEETCAQLERDVPNCKVYFVVATLEYLQKGGRIGKVASLFGNALNLKPIISCGDDGIYYTVAKVRGRKQSITKTKELALEYAQDLEHYNVAIMHGDAKDIAEQVKADILPKLPNMDLFVSDQVSPVLGVHTGTGAIGICIQKLDN